MSWTAAIQLPESLDGIQRYGCLAEYFIVLADGFDLGQMEQPIQQHGCMTDRKHEAITIRPYRVLRIETKKLLPEAVSHGAIAIGVPGCPEFAACTESIDSVR